MAFPYVPMGEHTRTGNTLVVNRYRMHLWIPALTEMYQGNSYKEYEGEGLKMSMYTDAWATRK
jgi:hypothetical protein